jgi:Family of unknown function (DUF6084)
VSAVEEPAAIEPEAPRAATGQPEPDFEVLAAAALERAAAPTLSFRLRVSESSGRRVFTVALSVLIEVEPAKRAYDDASRERLLELFGEPERWATTTQSFRWAQADLLVPPFVGSTEVELPIACTYDLELASSKYFDGLEGEAPLRFHFNGTVFYEADDGRLQLVQIPWDRTVRFPMPIAAWRRAIDAHFPHRAWVPVDRETLARIARLRAARGRPTFDATIADLLDREEGR